MWRSLFLAVGICFLLVGAQCLAVDCFVLKARVPPPKNAIAAEQKPGPNRQIHAPEWAPYTLMSTGAVVCLYSFAITRKLAGGK